MKENRKLLAFLSLVVIASGCSHTAGTTTGGTTSSVAVQNFSAFPSDVYNNQQVRLRLTLQNEGSVDAEDVQARLFNIPLERDSGSNNNVWMLDGDQSKSFGTLEAAEPENNLPAREANDYWTLESPDLADGVTIPYQFLTEVRYRYRTRGTSSITLMDQERFREQGTPSRPTLENTNGPIQMDIRTRSPIVFYSSDGSSQTSEMCVIVRNEGSGTPFLHNSETYDDGEYNVNDENSNIVKLRVRDQGRVSFESDTNSNTARVELLGNRGIGCFTISVEGWENGVGPQQEVPIVLEAIYGYEKETSTTVTVTGNQRFSGSDGSADNSDDEGDEDDSNVAGSAPSGPGG